MATISGARAAPAEQNTTHPYTCNSCQVAFRNGELQKAHMKGDWHRYNLKRRVANLAPISSEVFVDKVLQARATTTAQADKVGFEKVCPACQKTYYSENSFQNHMSSQKHKAKAAVLEKLPKESRADDASSVMSSTFSLGDPMAKETPELDSDAEEEFNQVIEGLKKSKLEDRHSPVKRPSNPHLSAEGQRKEEHTISPPSGHHKPSSPGNSTSNLSKTSAAVSSVTSCLFCNYRSPMVELNVAHMERFHGMFIPEKQYLVKLEGLISMLQKRIREDFECIYCGKVKSDVFAVQTHMRDKAHCMIPYTTLDEQLDIGDFYDFRATYSDSESDDDGDDGNDGPVKAGKQKGGAKLGAKRSVATTTTTAGQDGDDDDVVMGQDDGWETDSSASSLDSADLTAVPADHHYHQYERLGRHRHHSQTDPRAHHQRDGWHSHAHKHNHAVFYDEYELHLPSGKSLGHRAYNVYFRQNLRHYSTPVERAEQRRLAIEAGDDSDDHMDVDVSPESSKNQALVRGHDTAARLRGRPDLRARIRLAGSTPTVAQVKKHEKRTAKQSMMKPKLFKSRGRAD